MCDVPRQFRRRPLPHEGGEGIKRFVASKMAHLEIAGIVSGSCVLLFQIAKGEKTNRRTGISYLKRSMDRLLSSFSSHSCLLFLVHITNKTGCGVPIIGLVADPDAKFF